MSSLLIKISNKKDLARMQAFLEEAKLQSVAVNDSLFEDILLGLKMDRRKTGKLVSQKTILNKLRSE